MADRAGPALPTRDDLRWARLARELPFEELEAARKQAEQWRNAIGGLTALLGVAALVRGRNDLTSIPSNWRVSVALVLAAAFLSLLLAFALSAYASFGRPGVRIRLNGSALRRWSGARTRQIGRLVPVAAAAAALGIVLTGVAAFLTWFAPATAGPSRPYAVRTATGQQCGELIGVDRGRMVLRTGPNSLWSTPLAEVISISEVKAC
ncbi:hypothetical protein [Actinoplanes sp. NPDC048796]|uniref:hypothetical protein n=1 Tax=Actinoplanes sp. NPDC048796 TaxID=3155640 RepID=UPI0033EB4E17